MTAKPKQKKAASRRGAKNGRSLARNNILRSELLDCAVKLLAERGFGGTNLQDVADALGISRPAIYHYFPSKDSLLAELVAEVTLPSAKLFDGLADRKDVSPIDRIREGVRRLALFVLERPLHFKMMDRCEGELPSKVFAAHHDAKRRVLAAMTALIQNGIDGGQVRAVDAKIASFSMIGMCNWCAWWYRPDGAYSATQIADEIAEMAVHALRRSVVRDASLDIRNLTDEVRDTLRFIERIAART